MTRRCGFTFGFSLIEIMLVLAVLSVLAAMAWPGYTDYMAKARRTEGQVALVSAMQQQEYHRAVHHTYVALSSAEPVDGMPWWSGSRAPDSAYELDAQACPGSTLRDCVQIRARPGTALVDARHRDPECGTLTLSSTGEQGASGNGARCWP